MKRNVIAVAGLAALVLMSAPLRVAAQAPADRWTFSLTPYLWLPSVEGNLRYGPPAPGGATPNVTIDSDSLAGNLDMAFMGSAEARKGRWSIATDVLYVDLSADSSRVASVDFNPGPGPVNIFTTSLNAAFGRYLRIAKLIEWQRDQARKQKKP